MDTGRGEGRSITFTSVLGNLDTEQNHKRAQEDALLDHLSSIKLTTRMLAVLILILAIFDQALFISWFSSSLPSGVGIDDVWAGRFTRRVDNSGQIHDLSTLCETQKGGFVLSMGMLVWMGYSAAFSLRSRISSWYMQGQMQSYENRVLSVLEQRMSGASKDGQQDVVKAPPPWAADNAEWVDWIQQSGLAVIKVKLAFLTFCLCLY